MLISPTWNHLLVGLNLCFVYHLCYAVEDLATTIFNATNATVSEDWFDQLDQSIFLSSNSTYTATNTGDLDTIIEHALDTSVKDALRQFGKSSELAVTGIPLIKAGLERMLEDEPGRQAGVADPESAYTFESQRNANMTSEDGGSEVGSPRWQINLRRWTADAGGCATFARAAVPAVLAGEKLLRALNKGDLVFLQQPSRCAHQR